MAHGVRSQLLEVKMTTSRREFIQIGGAGLGAAALGSGLTTRWRGLDPDVVHDPGTVAPKKGGGS